MRKTIVIAVMLISFILALNAYTAEPDRGKGQCSYHGGLNKTTGACNDGTTPGAYAPEPSPSTCKKGNIPCEDSDPVAPEDPMAKPKPTAKELAATEAKMKACLRANDVWDNAVNKADAYLESGSCGFACKQKVTVKYALASCKTDYCKAEKQKLINTAYAKCDANSAKWNAMEAAAEVAHRSAISICCKYDPETWCGQ